jgi:hypothetical protein
MKFLWHTDVVAITFSYVFICAYKRLQESMALFYHIKQGLWLFLKLVKFKRVQKKTKPYRVAAPKGVIKNRQENQPKAVKREIGNKIPK